MAFLQLPSYMSGSLADNNEMQSMGQDSIMMGQTKTAIENMKPKVCVSVLASLEPI
jgi:uncharacterized protein YjbJ (UPF0337 family)